MIIIACTVVVHVDVASGGGRSGIDINLLISNAIAVAQFFLRRWTGLECHGGNSPIAIIVETAIIESQPRTELGG